MQEKDPKRTGDHAICASNGGEACDCPDGEGTCVKCQGGQKGCDKACECGHGCPRHFSEESSRQEHGKCCSGYKCAYGCEACFCGCHP